MRGRHPAGNEGGHQSEGQAKPDILTGQRCMVCRRRMIERVDGSSHRFDCELCTGPAQEKAQPTAQETKNGRFGQPCPPQHRLGDSERPENGNLRTPPHDGSVKSLENEIEADQECDEGKNGEVEPKRPGHGLRRAPLRFRFHHGPAPPVTTQITQDPPRLRTHLIRTRAGLDQDFNPVNACPTIEQGLQRGEIEHHQGRRGLRGVGRLGDRARDVHGHNPLVDNQVDLLGQFRGVITTQPHAGFAL